MWPFSMTVAAAIFGISSGALAQTSRHAPDCSDYAFDSQNLAAIIHEHEAAPG